MTDPPASRDDDGRGAFGSNLLDGLEELAARMGVEATADVRRDPAGRPDAALFIPDRAWEVTADGRRLIDGLAGSRWLASVRPRGRRITVRFADGVVARIGQALEAGRADGLATTDLLEGRSYLVDFCDPNATKALHVGHLRNIALGNAIAALLGAAGARVVRQSVICDIGRNVCEAMAGYMRFHGGSTPESAGLKSDVFVGRCYADYVRSAGAAAPEGDGTSPDAPISRELETRNDLAQEILMYWLEGERRVRATWEEIRRWCISGQEQTLARLGIRFDRLLYESGALDVIGPIVQTGVAQGLFRRAPDGSVSYPTGRREYEAMPLLRSDGFPTEHLRALGLWHALRVDRADLDGCIHVMGDEWLVTTTCREEILARFGRRPRDGVYRKVPYGMVYLGGSKMKSGSGTAVLIDELIDALAESDRVAGLIDATGGGAGPDDVARIVSLGYFLDRPPSKPIEFSWDRVLSESENAGWALAAAWARARSGRRAATAPDPTDPLYRYAVLQSQRFRRFLRHSATQFDVVNLVRYLTHLGRWYLRAGGDDRLDRVMQATLGAGLSALGLLPPRAA